LSNEQGKIKIMAKHRATTAPRKTLKIHVKILTEPEGVTLRQMFSAMSKIYDTAGIDVVHASTQTLKNVETLNDLDIGQDGTDTPACRDNPTEEQNALAAFRSEVPEGEIVVYICRSLTNGNVGCATHPKGIPMAVITATSPLYTMAHEVTHVLGRKGHFKKLDSTRLMNSAAIVDVEDAPLPILTASEINKIRSSPFLQ